MPNTSSPPSTWRHRLTAFVFIGLVAMLFAQVPWRLWRAGVGHAVVKVAAPTAVPMR